ncbi:MAG: hypothetical protein AB1545_16865 [Thermodesulfobacteriota bacterium]
MEKVSYELVEGLRSFQNLWIMVSEALAAQKIPIYRASPGWEWYGFYIEEKKLFVGIYYDTPNAIQVTSECKIKVSDGAKLDLGVVEFGKWRNFLFLDSEEVHFFSRSIPSQAQCIEKFIRESVDYAKANII